MLTWNKLPNTQQPALSAFDDFIAALVQANSRLMVVFVTLAMVSHKCVFYADANISFKVCDHASQ